MEKVLKALEEIENQLDECVKQPLENKVNSIDGCIKYPFIIIDCDEYISLTHLDNGLENINNICDIKIGESNFYKTKDEAYILAKKIIQCLK